jgi:thiol:disulfide interchange protein DsbG
MNGMQKITQRWQQIPPKKKVVVLAAVIAVFGISGLYLVLSNESTAPHVATHKAVASTGKLPQHPVSKPIPHLPPATPVTAGHAAMALTPPTGLVPTLVPPPHQGTSNAKPLGSAAQRNTQAMDLVQTASNGSAMAVSTFPGPTGITGVVYKVIGNMGPTYGLAWVLNHQKLVLLGQIVNRHGKTISGPSGFVISANTRPLVAATPTASTLPASTGPVSAQTAAMVSALDVQNGFTEGHGGSIVTVYFDPDSKKAMSFYKSIMPLVNAGKITIRWAPVAMNGVASLERAEYILSAPNPAVALRINFSQFSIKQHHGGSPLDRNMTMMEEIDANTDVLARLQKPVPLAVFYCDQKTAMPAAIWEAASTKALQQLLPKMGADCP